MKRPPVEQVGARWRIVVAPEAPFCVFDVDLDGRTHSLTAEAARRLVAKLKGLLDAASRFADEQEAREAQTGP